MHELHKPVTQILHLITYDMEYKLKHQYLQFNEEQKKNKKNHMPVVNELLSFYFCRILGM